MTPSKRGLPDVLLLTVAAAWGSTYWVAKELVIGLGVLNTLSLRMTLTAVLLGLCNLIVRRPLSAAARLGGVGSGTVLTAVFLLETYGLSLTTATNAGLIISLTMLFTPMAEAQLTKTPISRKHLAAAALATFGVALLTTQGQPSAPTLGDWLMLGAAVARTAHVLAVRHISREHRPPALQLTFVQVAVCGVATTVLAFVAGDRPDQDAVRLGGAMVIQLAFLTLAATVFAFFVQTWATRRTSASHVSLMLGTEPAFAALVGVTFAGDRLGVVGWAGLVVVLVALIPGRASESETPTVVRRPSSVKSSSSIHAAADPPPRPGPTRTHWRHGESARQLP